MHGVQMSYAQHLPFAKACCRTVGVAEAWAVAHSCWLLMLRASHRKSERLQGLEACSGERQAGLVAPPLAGLEVFEGTDPLAVAAGIQPGPRMDAAYPCAACCRFWQVIVRAQAYTWLLSVVAVRWGGLLGRWTLLHYAVLYLRHVGAGGVYHQLPSGMLLSGPLLATWHGCELVSWGDVEAEELACSLFGVLFCPRRYALHAYSLLSMPGCICIGIPSSC